MRSPFRLKDSARLYDALFGTNRMHQTISERKPVYPSKVSSMSTVLLPAMWKVAVHSALEQASPIGWSSVYTNEKGEFARFRPTRKTTAFPKASTS